MAEVTDVEVLHGRVVRLTFSDGLVRSVDLSEFLWGPALSDLASDDELFNAVKVDPELGTIVWPNGADLDPDVLHGDFEPAFPTQS